MQLILLLAVFHLFELMICAQQALLLGGESCTLVT